MIKNILLIGRKGIVLSDAKSELQDLDFKIYTGTNVDEVWPVFAQVERIDHVFMGAGIGLQKRLEIVREVLVRSGETCI